MPASHTFVPTIPLPRAGARALCLGLSLSLGVLVAACDEPSATSTPAPTSSQEAPAKVVTVPDVVGMEADAAKEALEAAGLTQAPSLKDAKGEEPVRRASDWSVLEQSPAAGEQVGADQEVTLMLNHDSAEAKASAAAAAEQAAQEQAAREQAAREQAPEPQSFVGQPGQGDLPAQHVYFSSCKEAKAAGAAPLYEGEPGYRPGLDRDRDGVACER